MEVPTTTAPTEGPTAGCGSQPLSPRVRSLWHLLWGIGAGVVVLVALGIGLAAASAGAAAVAAASAAIAMVAVAAAVAVPRARYRRWRWELTDEGLEVAHGVLVRVESAIPVFRVQQIDVRQGPLERAFGLVTLQITTASSGSDGLLPGIDEDRAEAVRRQLLGRAAADDGV